MHVDRVSLRVDGESDQNFAQDLCLLRFKSEFRINLISEYRGAAICRKMVLRGRGRGRAHRRFV